MGKTGVRWCHTHVLAFDSMVEVVWVAIIGVHMAVTNIGIWSYLSTGYTLQEAPVAAIERKIENLDERLSAFETLEAEALTGIRAMDDAYQNLVVKRFVTRAERYEEENAEKRAALEAKRDSARAEIRKLKQERATLEESAVENAAKLGSIEHISAFTDGGKEETMKIVAFFTGLLVLGLDPAAILMVIMFTFLLGKALHDDQSEGSSLSAEKQEVVNHLDEIGYLDKQTKSRSKK